MSLEIAMIIILAMLLIPTGTYAIFAHYAIKWRDIEIETMQICINEIEARWRSAVSEAANARSQLSDLKKERIDPE